MRSSSCRPSEDLRGGALASPFTLFFFVYGLVWPMVHASLRGGALPEESVAFVDNELVQASARRE
jgi:hypothetical protein